MTTKPQVWDIKALLAFHREQFGSAVMTLPNVGGGDAGNSGEAGTGDNGGAGAGDTKVEFTPEQQAAVDRIVKERVARAEGKAAKPDPELVKKAAEFDKLQAAQASELERAVQAAKDETTATLMTQVQTERVLDRVEALAGKTFADPEDARLRLASRASEFVTKDGKPDSDAIKAELSELLKEKPHLAAKGDGRPHGNADQGAHRENINSGDPKARRAAATEQALSTRT